MHSSDLNEIKVYPVIEDLEAAANQQPATVSRRRKHWEPLFFSNHFLAEYEELSLEAFALKKRQLRRIGKEVSNARRDIADAAKEAVLSIQMSPDDQLREVLKVARKIRSRGLGEDPNYLDLPADSFKESTPIDMRKRFTARKPLSV